MDKQFIQQSQGQQKNETNQKDNFNKYPSIQLSEKTKFIDNIRKNKYHKHDIMWVATEKIHGANFSIYLTQKNVRYGKRTTFITDYIDIECEDIKPFFKQNFFDSADLVCTFHHKLGNVYKNIKQIYPQMKSVVIYGQYFGGFHPTPDEKYKIVQRGVSYIPHHDFMAFDIKIETQDNYFWVNVQDIAKCLGQNLKSVPIYARGTFDEMLKINSKIDSTIPQALGFPKIQNNIIEGFVIRPNKSIEISNQRQRVILKIKNEEFYQAMKVNKKKKQVKVVDPAIEEYLNFLQNYVNINRVQSAYSKFPDAGQKKLKYEVLRDVMEDAIKDGYKEPDSKLASKIRTQLNKKVAEVVYEYTAKI